MSSDSSGRLSFGQLLDGASGRAQGSAGISGATLAASIAGAAIAFGVQFLIFFMLKDRLKRIFQPRTFLVPEKERTQPPPPGWFAWIAPVFKTSNSEFIHKCGLDAYFFVRYLRLLLKIFFVLAIVILPILLPINAVGGVGLQQAQNGTLLHNVTGVDTLAWGNVSPQQTSRFWAHCILAILTVAYVCYIFYDELKGYIRLRQAYLTTPQHRLRASATTILVTNIPMKWLTVEALDGLFDVFPGGLRNIWINRNYDNLSEKVEQRDSLARLLEGAETDLIKIAYKKHLEKVKAEIKGARKAGKITKSEGKAAAEQATGQADGASDEPGVSSGDPHQIPHTLKEVMDEAEQTEGPGHQPNRVGTIPIPVLGKGLGVLGEGVGVLGRRVDRLGSEVAGGVAGGINKVRIGLDERLETADMGAFAAVPVVDLDGHPTNEVALQPLDGTQPSTILRESPATRDSPGSKSTLRPGMDPFSPVRESRIAGRHALPPSDMKNAVEENSKSKLSFWLRGKRANFPSPQPHQREDDEYPLSSLSPITPTANRPAVVNGEGEDNMSARKAKTVTKSKEKHGEKNNASDTVQEYPEAYNADQADDKGAEEPKWKQYLSEKNRPTHHLPPFGQNWLSWLSWTAIGKKVDTIYYCRRELARLNVEIEQDQKNPDKFPLMSSAFIQFNHQVAAHMACQSVSHHLPKAMTPRTLEIDPKDVDWDNMSMKWWERYIRTIGVLVLFIGFLILWAIPITFTGLLSKISTLVTAVPWLAFISRWPNWALAVVQGILPQVLLALLLVIAPLIVRLIIGRQGPTNGAIHELSVAKYYFSFLFFELFLVISISSGITVLIRDFVNNFGNTLSNVPGLLAQNLPKASNYFFSYMVLQALTVSAGALVQIWPLISWFAFRVFDNTAHDKFQRQIGLPSVQWGTFFPVYANLAAIGLIYSIIAPLILVFNVITFSLFWFVYRYNSLYVNRFTFDTGGLLFPLAINQLFTGLYVMELCLIGLFFLTQDVQGRHPCIPQGAIMIAVTILTIIYQFLLNEAFSPLFKYLPITLEDDAVRRDEEFARAQQKKFHLAEEEQESDDIEHVLDDRERRERDEERQAHEIELKQIEAHKSANQKHILPDSASVSSRNRRQSWADRRPSSDAKAHRPLSPHLSHPGGITGILRRSVDVPGSQFTHRKPQSPKMDVEAQRTYDKSQFIADQLFSDLPDELEDLTPEERDVLVQHAFQHKALRARRPCIWIPRDELGISDDEIMRTKAFAGGNIWISNEWAGLDSEGRVVLRRAPPDYSEWDLINL